MESKMNDIQKMELYLIEAECFVDTVYNFAQEQKGSVADELRSEMNVAGSVINNARSLLNKLGMPRKEMLEKLEIAQGLLSSVYHNACEHGDSEIESQMSMADSCIIDAISKLG
jgi:hypothetical protein